MKLLNLFLISLLFSSCVTTATFDYEKSADFTTYKTYSFYDDIDTGLSVLDTKRLIDVMHTALQARGFTFAEDSDFKINIQSSEYENNNTAVGVGVGGTGGNVGGGISIGIPLNGNTNREIIFEFVDHKGIGVFWQAICQSRYNPNANPEKREANLKAVFDKVLEGYPPKVKQ